MFRNMVTDFLDKERIITTVAKAKELRSFAEKMITLGKRDNLHSRRRALSIIRRKSVVHKLFDSLAPRYADRNGGFTRIIRLGFRKGDSVETAIIELVDREGEKDTTKKSKKSKKTPSQKEPESENTA